jgi:hypothetical protein
MATGSKGAVALAVGVGVLMDLDHVYDYYQWYVKGRRNRILVFLHAWEYSAAGLGLLAAGIYHPFLWATVLAHLAHVCTDQLFNDVSRFGYSMIYRLIRGFGIAAIAPNLDPATEYRRLHRHIPFSQHWESWFERRVYPWFDQRINRPVDSEGVDSIGAPIGPRGTGEER